MRVLMSAYACEPESGSEPEVGWRLALELARHHDVTVLTRENNIGAITAALGGLPQDSRPRFEGYDLPWLLRALKRGQRGVQLYYYLWQIGAGMHVRRRFPAGSFDVVHHVTFVKYWSPALVRCGEAPFVWGPVGGGAGAPWRFWSDLGVRGAVYECARLVVRRLARLDPLLHATARAAKVALASDKETEARLASLGCRDVRLLSQVALAPEDLTVLGNSGSGRTAARRFICVGRLLPFKGFHMAIRALAAEGLEECCLEIVGNGPDLSRLRREAVRCGVQERVTFRGALDRPATLRAIASADCLVLTSLHESGSIVCAEAMAAGRPLIFIDAGGPSTIVPRTAGIALAPTDPTGVVARLSAGMLLLARDVDLCAGLGAAGAAFARESLTWEARGDTVSEIYRQVIATAGGSDAGRSD